MKKINNPITASEDELSEGLLTEIEAILEKYHNYRLTTQGIDFKNFAAHDIMNLCQQKDQQRIKELRDKLKEQWEWSQGALDWRESEISKAKAEERTEIANKLIELSKGDCSIALYNFIAALKNKRTGD
jgi:hypothetical protein